MCARTIVFFYTMDLRPPGIRNYYYFHRSFEAMNSNESTCVRSINNILTFAKIYVDYVVSLNCIRMNNWFSDYRPR